MAFSIGGKLFPIDPLDFMAPLRNGDTNDCVADRITSTDPPSVGATFTWSLGDPFFKSNLVAFYYGNLTHPSLDPPRMGCLSTTANNGTAEVNKAIGDAKHNKGSFDGA